MPTLVSRGRHFSIAHVWFESDVSIADVDGVDRLFWHGCERNISSLNGRTVTCAEQRTLINDLAIDQEDLIRKFTKTVRNEINRSERGGVKVAFYTNCDESVLGAFDEMYSAMYAEKGLGGNHVPIPELKSYMEAGCFLLSTASIDGTPVVYHSYIWYGNDSRLLHSCSEFRGLKKSDKNAIARANKYLHWQDMLYLRRGGG